jgi:hypothetical protein
MSPIMEIIADFLSCNLRTVKKNSKIPLKLEAIDMLSVEISSLSKIENLINYFHKFPLRGRGLRYQILKIGVSFIR